MSFRFILDELLVTTHGALAAIFLDWEGETVELVCDRDLSDHQLRILGAYQSIFLTRLRAMCAQVDAGSPQRFKIEFDNLAVMSYDVRDGYFIVLLVDDSSNEGISWRRMERCRERLLADM
jgi:predicted regulator of Ras-like GTPase activity (Roadblock/LC7/MglB family)